MADRTGRLLLPASSVISPWALPRASPPPSRWSWLPEPWLPPPSRAPLPRALQGPLPQVLPPSSRRAWQPPSQPAWPPALQPLPLALQPLPLASPLPSRQVLPLPWLQALPPPWLRVLPLPSLPASLPPSQPAWLRLWRELLSLLLLPFEYPWKGLQDVRICYTSQRSFAALKPPASTARRRFVELG